MPLVLVTLCGDLRSQVTGVCSAPGGSLFLKVRAADQLHPGSSGAPGVISPGGAGIKGSPPLRDLYSMLGCQDETQDVQLYLNIRNNQYFFSNKLVS